MKERDEINNKNNEELLILISKEKNIYLNNIKEFAYKKDYEKILYSIKNISKNISSTNISQLIEEIKNYIRIYEDEPFNKIKSKINEYNKLIQKGYSNDKNNLNNSKVDEKLFINKILLETKDLIGCHIYYFVSQMFEICDILNYKTKYILMKDDLLKNIKNLEDEFQKLKKENYIEKEKEIKMKAIEKFKNNYESKIKKEARNFIFLKKIIHSGCLLDFYEFCDINLFSFDKIKNKYSELNIIFPLIHFFELYIKEKKYDFLKYKIEIENTDKNNNLILFKNYNLFKINVREEEKINKKIIKELIENDEKELLNLFEKFEKVIEEKCDINNFIKKKFTYKEEFNFIPQIEIKFNEVKEITKELIDNLYKKLNELFQGKEVKIIEMKKGSLDLAITLNYLIKDAIKNVNMQNISLDKFLETLNSTLNIETNNIKNMLYDNLIVGQQDKQFKPDFVNQNLLDLTTEESKDKLSQCIKTHFSKNDNENNIFEISQNITPDDIKSFYDKLFKETKTQQDDLYDIILNNEFQEYLSFFDSEFEKALQNSIFEYNTKFIAYIYRNDEDYRGGKLHCNNIKKRIVFHGTRSWAISRILSTNFRHAETHFFGIGTYFTDLLDYAWFYAAETDNGNGKFKNVSRIPKIKESFSFIASEIYYDSSRFDQVYDMAKEDQSVPKNGIRHVCVDYRGSAIPKKDLPNHKEFMGTEYIITEKEQILPLLNVTVERVEFLIIWRDNNFNFSNPNGYKDFQDMFDWNNKIKKYAAFNLKTKIYYFNESNEALNFIKRKKYNKIILISNGGNNGIGFINDARKIIGNNTISLITCYVAQNYMNVIQKTENILLNSKYYNCIKEFLCYSTNKNINALKNLQKDVENNLKNLDNSFSFKPLNNNAFNFQYFKNGGNFNEIKF